MIAWSTGDLGLNGVGRTTDASIPVAVRLLGLTVRTGHFIKNVIICIILNAFTTSDLSHVHLLLKQGQQFFELAGCAPEVHPG